MHRVLLIVVFLLILLGIRFWMYYKDVPQYTHGQVASLITRVADEPKIVFGRQQFNIKDEYGNRIKVITSSSPLLQIGEKLDIDGVFTKREYNDNFYLSLYFPKVQILNSEDNILTKSAIWTRKRAQSLYESSLPPISSSLLLGILFGGKHGMPEAFSEHLRVSGVMHVIAASGMNVTFVAGAMMGILGVVLKRQFAIVIAGFGIVFYMFLAGFEESIVRAGIMAIFAFGASLLGRQYYGLFSLIVVLCLMLLYSPNLLFNVGFQLSFLATLGIIIFRPNFAGHQSEPGITGYNYAHGNTHDRRNSFPGKIPGIGILFDDIGTTISAQIFALPVMMTVFGSVGILSIAANALILWTIPILMTFGALAFILGIAIEPLGMLFLYLSLPFLLFFETVVSFIGGFGWVWEVEEFPWQLSVGYYLFLLGMVLYLKKRKDQKQ